MSVWKTIKQWFGFFDEPEKPVKPPKAKKPEKTPKPKKPKKTVEGTKLSTLTLDYGFTNKDYRM